ncbi:MAG: arginine--tRNA ligase [Burkholderiales bacterium]|nr:arginine--tRNA ligase [Burkholderiales bacterium]
MPRDPKTVLSEALAEALAGEAPEAGRTAIGLERPKNAAHGDWSSNVALQVAARLGRNPRELAQKLCAAPVWASLADIVEPPQVAGPGFVNFRLRPAAKLAVIHRVLAEGERYGHARAAKPEKVMVEFVSANPTGPLHVGHGRQAALGDAIAALIASQGHEVTREFYYNDAGAQIRNLALSVQARARGIAPGEPGWPADGYQGEYVVEIARAYAAAGGDLEDLEAVRRFAVAYLRREQDEDLRAFGVAFDVYSLESALYAEGKVEEVVQALVSRGKTYEKDGALWLRTTDYGDDKDRVMRKADGSYTYFVPDVAYHVGKWRRGYTRVVNVQGSDHHSTITRVRAGLQALAIGIPAGWPEYVLHSMVRVVRGGEEVKISKRAGAYVTLRDLIDWAGRDAVRFFLVSRRPDADFVFDVDLALARTEDNPVYYVQYAHARISSVLAQWGEDPARLAAAPLAPLALAREAVLARELAAFPEVLAQAAAECAPHAVAFYLRNLASEFHSYYNAERILVEERALREARLALAAAVRQTLANGLRLLGVSAPEKM